MAWNAPACLVVHAGTKRVFHLPVAIAPRLRRLGLLSNHCFASYGSALESWSLDCKHDNPKASGLYSWPLAQRYDTSARVSGVGPQVCLADDLPVFCTLALSAHRGHRDAVWQFASSGSASDGQHESRMGTAAGRRICVDEPRGSDPLPAPDVSQQSGTPHRHLGLRAIFT